MRRLWISLIGLLLPLLATTSTFAQNCCMPSLNDDPDASKLVSGIAAATVLLIAVPYALVATVAVRFYRSYRNADRESR